MTLILGLWPKMPLGNEVAARGDALCFLYVPGCLYIPLAL